MRQSNRTTILDAAVRVAQAHGIGGVTLDAVADRAGLTKGGLLYHFASKDALLLAVQEHLAAAWERELEHAAGKPATEVTERERIVAYVQVLSRSASHAELAMQLEAVSNPALNAPWAAVLSRWRPSFDPADQAEASLAGRVAVLAAEGLWSAELLGLGAIDRRDREPLVRRILGDLALPSADPVG